MDGVDPLALARPQFAFTVAFHIVFPAFSIGLASYLAVLNALHLRTGQAVYLALFDYWKTIFAVAFGMGVVSGHRHVLPVRHQLVGLLRPRRADRSGRSWATRCCRAFFLEAGFLGVMLFGRSSVGPGLHFFATLMVAMARSSRRSGS